MVHTNSITQSNHLQILLADDHPIVRRGLVSIISEEQDMKIVAEAENGFDAVEKARLFRPDVILLDLAMPIMDGAEALLKILEDDPAAKVIILTTYDVEEDIYRTLSCGALGYMIKDTIPSELIDGIRRVASGRKAVGIDVAEKLTGRMVSNPLSDRELEVLRLIAVGEGNKQIGVKLGIAQGTVKAHISSLFTKLGAQSRTEVVAIALRRGMIRLDT